MMPLLDRFDELERLRAENARLRDALEYIKNWIPDEECAGDTDNHTYLSAIARQALEGK